MEKINDYYHYTQLMRNGFYDKLFFIDKLFEHWESLVDFGCAEGFQTKLIAKTFTDKAIYGYDPDKGMILLAQNSGDWLGNTNFSISKEILKGKDVILFSSVLHEVYTYNADSINEFWSTAFAPDRKYVIIRDMMYSDKSTTNLELKHSVRRQGCQNQVIKYVEKIKALGELERFQNIFGSIDNPKCLIHFMLKLPYINSPNWNREIHEDYLSVSIEMIEKLIPLGWEIEFKEEYQLSWLKYWWREEVGINNFPYNTHTKYIIRNNNLK